MTIDIVMPALSPTMTVGRIVKWYKSKGDKVESGDRVADIETDKAVMEVEAADDGVIGKILVAEGTEIAVGSVIAILLEDGETESSLIIDSSRAKNDHLKNIDKIDSNVACIDTKDVSCNKSQDVRSEKNACENDNRIKISPVAKILSKQYNIDLTNIEGTGYHGIITKNDIKDHIANLDVDSGNRMNRDIDTSDVCKIEITSKRKIIASKLQESMRNAPHFYLSIDVDATDMLIVRSNLNQSILNRQNITGKK